MIWFFTPFSFNKKLFEAFDQYMNLVPDPEDWVVMMDGDTAFLLPNFGHQIKTYTEKYPDTGLFTCYASRCHYQCQVPTSANMNSDSILYHKKIANTQYSMLNGEVKEINRRIAGHLMVMKKKTWLKIRDEVKSTARGKNILGVDTKISNAILKAGLKIRLMQGMYIFHYLRMEEGFNYKKHLE